MEKQSGNDFPQLVHGLKMTHCRGVHVDLDDVSVLWIADGACV
jgi:hypothetical protein